jgi:hypothetical protein
MRIGVTLHLTSKPRSVWECGAGQHCLFLIDALRRVPGVERVFAVNGGDGDTLPGGIGPYGPALDVVRIGEVADDLDVLIQVGSQLPREDMLRVRAHGGRVVAYKVGNEYVINAERAMQDKACPAIVEAGFFDELWTNAQHVDTCAAYWETLYRAPVQVLPHVWLPTFLDAAVADLPAPLAFGYQPGRAQKRLAIYEPNVNIVKTSTIPMLVAEECYRAAPELLEHVYVACASKVKTSQAFVRFASALDLVRDHHMSFEGRYHFPWFQAKHADVVVSHQWENGLNYAYYEALAGHYPLVHNSPLLPDGVGYRYSGFDCADGGAVLRDALEHHDERRADYDRRADDFLATVRADAPANIDAHARALQRLTERRQAA